MATEKIEGCGQHKIPRMDIQNDSSFDDLFHFDCPACCSDLPKNSKLCDACQKWNCADYVFKTHFSEDISCGCRSVSEYMAQDNCIVCRVLLEAVLEMVQSATQASKADDMKVVNCGPYHFEGTVWDAQDHIVNLKARGGKGRCVFLLLVSPEADKFFAGRMSFANARKDPGGEVDEGVWRDGFLSVQVEMQYKPSGLGLLGFKRWETSILDIVQLSGLIKEHEAPRSKDVTGELPKGFRLIDTVDKCIYEPASSDTPRFVTLSYTWGSSAGQRCDDLTKETLDEMIKPGALREENCPFVIWDAIQLCYDLGEKYLWTDRLCIKQNGPQDLSNQVAQMDRIYGQAAFSISSVVDHQQRLRSTWRLWKAKENHGSERS